MLRLAADLYLGLLRALGSPWFPPRQPEEHPTFAQPQPRAMTAPIFRGEDWKPRTGAEVIEMFRKSEGDM